MVEQETLTILPDGPAESSRLKLVCTGLGAGLLLLLIILIVQGQRLSSKSTTLSESQKANDDLALKLKKVEKKVADDLATAKGQSETLQKDVVRLTKELESAKTNLEQSDGRLSIAHAKNESLVDQLANRPGPDEPTEQEKLQAKAVMRIVATKDKHIEELLNSYMDAYNDPEHPVNRQGFFKSGKKTDSVYRKGTDHHRWYVCHCTFTGFKSADLLHAPEDYRTLHNRLAILVQNMIESGVRTTRYSIHFAWDLESNGIFLKAYQEYADVIDKYRLIAGEKPKEVGLKPEDAAEEPDE